MFQTWSFLCWIRRMWWRALLYQKIRTKCKCWIYNEIGCFFLFFLSVSLETNNYCRIKYSFDGNTSTELKSYQMTGSTVQSLNQSFSFNSSAGDQVWIQFEADGASSSGGDYRLSWHWRWKRMWSIYHGNHKWHKHFFCQWYLLLQSEFITDTGTRIMWRWSMVFLCWYITDNLRLPP